MEFPEIDKERTIQNVDQLLKKYHTFRRLSGQPVPQKLSSVISEEPRASGSRYTTEDRIVDKIQYAEILHDINDALSVLDRDTQNLLWGKYIAPNRYNDYQRYSKLCISKSTYYRWLDHARLLFAEAYHNGELVRQK